MPHVVGIVNQGFGESKEKKTPFFFLEFKPLYESHPDGCAGAMIDAKYSRTVKMFVTDKTVNHVRKRLAELGWTGAAFRELDPAVAGHHSFVGSEVLLECVHKDGYEEWAFPYDGPAAAPKESDPSLSRKLDALFGKSGAPAAKKPQAAKPKTTGEEIAKRREPTDQEIPF